MHSESLKLWPFELCKIPSAFLVQQNLPDNLLENFQTSEAYISITLDLNDIKFGRVVKMSFSTTFQEFGPVAPNLHNTVYDEINQYPFRMMQEDPHFKSFERIYTIDFSISLEIKSPL